MSRILRTAVVCCVFLRLASAFEYRYIEGDRRGEGESCEDNGEVGTCTRITKCHVYTHRGPWWKLKICGFYGYDTVICCPYRVATTTTTTTTTTPKPVSTTPPMGHVTTVYIPAEEVYVRNDPTMDECADVPSNSTDTPNGNKSHDKCIEYQQQLIYPCVESNSILGGKVRKEVCSHNADALIVGGTDATRDEFPHMVLLGYGRSKGSAVWECGGTLISDRFILTAAHCTSTSKLGNVSYAIVGSLKRTDDVEYWQVHRIRRIIKHPDFNSLTKHNDIALLETDPIKLGPSTVPACLDVFGGDRDRSVATGWGVTAYLGGVSDTLQKVTLTKFTDRECSEHYPRNRFRAVFNSTIQVCYGDYSKSADTCQGDSGGPLTILNHRLHCMYTVVGITSFGMHCGTVGQPGWYTKVSHYVPWIESIVWP